MGADLRTPDSWDKSSAIGSIESRLVAAVDGESVDVIPENGIKVFTSRSIPHTTALASQVTVVSCVYNTPFILIGSRESLIQKSIGMYFSAVTSIPNFVGVTFTQRFPYTQENAVS